MRASATRRWTVRILLLVAAACVLGFVGWTCGDGPRALVEQRLAQALGRDVSIDAMEFNNGVLELEGVRIGSPPSFAGRPLLGAGSIQLAPGWIDLACGRVTGTFVAADVRVAIDKRGGLTNAHGLGKRRERGSERVLDLEVTLVDAQVDVTDLDLRESLSLQGINATLQVSNRDTEHDAADLVLDAKRIRIRGVGIDDVHAELNVTPRRVQLGSFKGRVGQHGVVRAGGELSIESQTPWRAVLEAEGVKIDEDVFGAVAAFYPGIAGSADIPDGTVGLSLDVRGRGLRASGALEGTLELELESIRFARQSLFAQLLVLAGRGDVVPGLDRVQVRGTFANGWFVFDAIETKPADILPEVQGRVSLGGALELNVELRPLLTALDAGHRDALLDLTTSFPVRVEGTVAQPSIGPPRWGAIGTGLAGGLLHRLTSASE